MTNVYIMSGLPGAGKSHLVREMAKTLLDEGKRGVVVSTDFFWYSGLFSLDVYFDELTSVDFGEYNFVPEKLPMAHPECMRAFCDILKSREDLKEDYTIIVDNTGINTCEIAPYYLVAQAFETDVKIIRVEAELPVCLGRQTHEVPEHIIIEMHNTFTEMVEHPWQPGVSMPKQHMPWWVCESLERV